MLKITCAAILLAAPMCAQTPKPGLWEVQSQQTWVQSPFPPGMPNPMGGGPRTNQVCVTQDQIDKFMTTPPTAGKSCSVKNVVRKPDGVTADFECTGPMSGKGTFEQNVADSEHTNGKVHFTGALPNGKPIEWIAEFKNTFKSADCGNVKPLGNAGH